MVVLEKERMEDKLMEELKSIERILLPLNCEFSDNQRRVILADSSANIIAGPGSGKTTVLIAKIAFWLKRVKELNKEKGICIITHTNVAVDEIKKQLELVGIVNFGYPNFIGTIHDFFNHFFTYKAYQELYPNKKVLLDEEEMYKDRFIKIFSDYNSPFAPTSRIQETYLKFLSDGTIDLIGECNEWCREDVINTFRDLLEMGIFRHNDTISFSNWYIKKYEQHIKNAFGKRFLWAFIDETQDTSELQYDLLMRIFNNGLTILQKFGDPYQALYTMFGKGNDAWVPSRGEIPELELSYSTRFGENIAKVLRTTCIEEYGVLKGNPNKKSFKPHLLLYSSKDNVIDEYLKLVQSLSDEDADFRGSNKKIGVVGLIHDEVRSYHAKYKRNSDIKPKTETIIKNFYEIVMKGLLMYVKHTHDSIPKGKSSYSLNYFNNLLRQEKFINIKSSIAVCIKAIYNAEGIMNDNIKKEIIKVYKKIIQLEGIVFNSENLLKKCMDHICNRIERNYLSYKHGQQHSQNNQALIEGFTEQDICFGTVHSVKGETHRATLLLESRVKKGDFNDPEIFYDCTEIFDFLIGNYRDYETEDGYLPEVIRDGLKTAYVALSRPTHLAAVAINKDNFGDTINEKRQTAIQAGWEVIEVN
ncbi:UvrD-helicase domain-containing protein [Bacillus thuringiensis]|uniref:UvrD-helicase domain-containing protein n=1 Tax=Bacillus thuringiensis TaxID=1428 RepID=UPI001F509E3B|nr:UvrD-helicase domain-containing protein [Bacillus thuringiensis]